MIKTIIAFLALSTAVFAAPKYGPDATPLSTNSNKTYFQKKPAADFWALIPYYIPQETGPGCSAANIAMILNAARVGLPLSSDDELITFKNLVDKYAEKKYARAIKGNVPPMGTLFANTNLAKVLKSAADKLKITNPATSVAFAEVDQKNLKASRERFIEALKQNEKSANDFIFFSFVQGKATGDPEGGAHVATVGAYDEDKNLVLVLDPDRKYYEPYWISADKLFEAISDPKSDSEKKTGWIYFKTGR